MRSASAFSLCVLAIASSAQAGSLGFIAIGLPVDRAKALLEAYGRVEETSLANEAKLLVAGDFIVRSCDGKVWSVSRQMQPTFRAFTSLSKRIELEQGRAPHVEITHDEGRVPFDQLALHWGQSDGTKVSAVYSVTTNEPSLYHTVFGSDLCK